MQKQLRAELGGRRRVGRGGKVGKGILLGVDRLNSCFVYGNSPHPPKCPVDMDSRIGGYLQSFEV